MICRWIREYTVKGEAAFDEVKRSGNKYAALHTSKNISETERLKLEIAKLRVENERIKKRVRSERSWCKQGVRYHKE